MKERLQFYVKRIKEGRLQEMWKQTKWVYQYARRYWKAMFFYTLLGMTGTVVSLLAGLVSKDLVDIITGHETGRVIQTFALMIGLNIGNTIVTQISSYASSKISLKVDSEIKADIFSKILVTDWESLTGYHTGDLLTRWSSDVSVISSGVLNYIPNMIIYVFRFLGAFAVVAYHDITFAIFAFLGMPASILLSKTLMRRMVNNNKRSAAMSAKMSGFNQESFSNIQTIKAFDLVGAYVSKLKALQQDFISMRLDFYKMSMGTNLLMSVINMLVSYSAYGWGIYRVWSGAISYGTMTMFLSLSGTLTGTVHNLTSLIPNAINLTTSAGRLMDIVEMPREDYSKKEEVHMFWEQNKERGISLSIRELSYTYRTGTQVFEAASLEVNPGEIIALVGPSGEGKTTMLRLILSLITGQRGEALLQGKKTGDTVLLTPSTRFLFSYVPQGNTMFSGTIAENMLNIKPEATEEEIISALNLACAWEFVEKLPDGIHSKVQERGGGFSEGQAQRLSIARALLRDTPILLLDEATSALDVATERKVLKNIMQDEHPRTCIVTTHRPTVLSACNRVYAIREKKCQVLTETEIEELVRGF
ncbi:MAG: ABC transporter ATP-binding protein [Lachnospiraceae bacterium]|nr:ABC transporter ATP-binding protein [Lachnospiraceae bacterium]